MMFSKKVKHTCTLVGEEVGRQQPCFGALQAPLAQYVDVIITSQCIHLYILCIVPRCLFQEVYVM